MKSVKRMIVSKLIWFFFCWWAG